MEPQLVAIGGGGFSNGPENLLLEDYILSLANKPNPKVSFLPTASGDSEQYLLKFYIAFAKLHTTASHLPLFRLAVTDLRSYILAQDVIYVGGGNTRNMLLIWREFGLDRILREAWEKGTVMCGSSAGSICWFEHPPAVGRYDQAVAVGGISFFRRVSSFISLCGEGFVNVMAVGGRTKTSRG
jgi:peptidase E